MPADDGMLLSIVNMKLRDAYGSVEELCDDLEWDFAELTARLDAFGYAYDERSNSFRIK